MNEDCEFCGIAAGGAPAAIVYEDDLVIGFLDRNPAATGHTLLVPKEHTTELFELDEGTTTTLFQAVRTVKTAIDDALDPVGISLFYTTGSLVGSIEHAHVHLVPRFEDDDVDLSLPRDSLDPAAGERLAAQIRREL